MLHKITVIFLTIVMVSGGLVPVLATQIPDGETGEQDILFEGRSRPVHGSEGQAPLAELVSGGGNRAEAPGEMLLPSGRAGPDVTPRNISFNDSNPTWFGLSVATVGEITEIEVFITNIGDANATNVGVRVEVLDFFDNILAFIESTIADIPPSSDVLVAWNNWTPTHSAKVHARVKLDLVADVDQGNNEMLFYGSGWWVDKWLDVASDQGAWSGDIAGNEWHVTSTITTDPDPSAHTSPDAWYAGTDGPVSDFYTANMNVSLISKSIDLKRMNPYYSTYINFKYYGGALPNDGIVLYASIDDGVTWINTRSTISGLTTVNGQPDWVVRIDNWLDNDLDGQRDPGEFDWGIDISEFVGHDVRFKFTFTSGPTSTGLGYYLDDFIVYGHEAENEISLVRIENLGTTKVGEVEDVRATFWNQGIGASPSLTVRMTVFKDSTELYNEDTTLSSISAGGSGEASWTFTPNETGDYNLEIELLSPPNGTDSSYYNNRQTRRVHVSSGTAGVLLVDDDGGWTNSGRLKFGNYEVDTDYLLVSAIDRELDVFHVLYNDQGPDAGLLSDYHTVVWSTGWDGTGRSLFGSLAPGDRASIRTFMDDGGSFWLISQEAIFDLMDDAPGFLSNYLHVTGYNDDAGTPAVIDGVPGDEISDGMSMSAVVRVPGNDRADSITPDGDSVGFTYQDENVQNTGTGPFNGIRYNGSNKMVFTSFEHSALFSALDRDMFSNAVLDWLFAGLSIRVIEPRKTVDAGGVANYTVRIRNHGSGNKTVSNLDVSSMATGWKADLSPRVLLGEPETVIEGFRTLDAFLLVYAPSGLPSGTEGRVTVELVVLETGEIFENATYTMVRETVDLNMTVSPKDQVGEGGRNASYLITLKNNGNVRTTVNMSLNGTIDTWATLDPAYMVLDLGETDDIILTLSIPRDAAASNYSLEVIVEGRFRNIIKEDRDTINVTVGQFQALSIKSVRAPDGGQIGPDDTTVSIVVEIDNNGNGPDMVTISLFGTFQEADRWAWGSREVLISAFEKGFRTNVSLGVWKGALGGEYNITVRALSQDGKTVAESYLIVTVLRPDLYVSLDGITFDYDLVVGQETGFKVKVYNGGEVDSQETNITVYDRARDLIYSGTTGARIKAGGFTEITVKWTPQYIGPEELEIHVNEDEGIVEMDYSNNTIIRSVVVYQPNLNIGVTELQFYVNGKVRDRVKAGDDVAITAQVKNLDDYSYEAEDVVIEFFLDGTLIGNKTTDIEANNIAIVKVDWKAIKGVHTVLVKVDSLDRIDEAKEDDNEISREIFVTAKEVSAYPALDPLWIGIIIAIAIAVGIVYAMARGAIPSPFTQSQVEIADRSYKCNECGKRIKKGREYYHCSCGARAHTKCAKRAELCECLKRVRIEDIAKK